MMALVEKKNDDRSNSSTAKFSEIKMKMNSDMLLMGMKMK